MEAAGVRTASQTLERPGEAASESADPPVSLHCTAQIRSGQRRGRDRYRQVTIKRLFIISTGRSSPQSRLNKTLGFITRIDLNSKVQLEHRELFYKYCSILCLCSTYYLIDCSMLIF